MVVFFCNVEIFQIYKNYEFYFFIALHHPTVFFNWITPVIKDVIVAHYSINQYVHYMNNELITHRAMLDAMLKISSTV